MSYPPIYIISLKRTPERKLHMQRQLDALDLNYRFVKAIDKYDLNSKAYRAKVAKRLDINETDMELLYSKRDTNGTLACLLSHIKAQNLVIKDNVRYACILEDGVDMLPTFPSILTVTGRVSWDILMLSSRTLYIRRIMQELYDSKFLGLYKLIRYKKYHPQLNPFFVRLITIKFVKLLFMRLRKINSQTSKQLAYIDVDLRRKILSLSCEIGGLPDQDRCSWHKVMRQHYIAPPYKQTSEKHFNLTSGMAYMLTPSAAHKWKKEAILSARESRLLVPIDLLPFKLYKKNDLSLYIVLPCCVRPSYRFLEHSAHRDYKKIVKRHRKQKA